MELSSVLVCAWKCARFFCGLCNNFHENWVTRFCTILFRIRSTYKPCRKQNLDKGNNLHSQKINTYMIDHDLMNNCVYVFYYSNHWVENKHLIQKWLMCLILHINQMCELNRLNLLQKCRFYAKLFIPIKDIFIPHSFHPRCNKLFTKQCTQCLTAK